MISLDNYEIWMLDYLDGNLSDSDEKLLLQFLDEHPHLKKELEGLDETILQPQDEVFDFKANLFKTSAEEYNISQVDFLAIKQLEDGLTAEEEVIKENYIKSDSKNNNTFESYKQTKLKADLSIRYAFKSSLKRWVLMPSLKVNTIRRIGIAATIAILLSVSTFPFLKETSQNLQTVAVNDTPSLIGMPKKVSKTNSAIQTNTAKEIQKIKGANVSAAERKVFNENAKSEITSFRKTDTLNLKPLHIKNAEPIHISSINAYEVGLNHMMPIIIANNIEQSMQDNLAMNSQIEEQSQRLSRSSRAILGGLKVINFLSGNETTMKKFLNEDGQMVAYQLESDNIWLRQQIKNISLEN